MGERLALMHIIDGAHHNLSAKLLPGKHPNAMIMQLHYYQTNMHPANMDSCAIKGKGSTYPRTTLLSEYFLFLFFCFGPLPYGLGWSNNKHFSG